MRAAGVAVVDLCVVCMCVLRVFVCIYTVVDLCVVCMCVLVYLCVYICVSARICCLTHWNHQIENTLESQSRDTNEIIAIQGSFQIVPIFLKMVSSKVMV